MTPYLQQFSPSDRKVIVGLLKKADLLKEELEAHIRSDNTCNLESLQLARLRGSNTLLRDTVELETWNLALQTISTWIQEDRTPKLDAFCEINRIVLKVPRGESPIRKFPLSAAGMVLPPPENLESLLNAFESELDSVLNNEHPVIQAAWTYQRLVAIHPFQDGNGRTCRLAADWILARSGFPPMVFLSPVAAMVPIDLGIADLRAQLTCMIRVANAIQTSGQILTMKLTAC